MKVNANFLKRAKKAPAKVKNSAAAGMKVIANQQNKPTREVKDLATADKKKTMDKVEDSAAADMKVNPHQPNESTRELLTSEVKDSDMADKSKTMDEMFQDLASLRKTIDEKELELGKWEHPDGWFSKDVEKSRDWIRKKADTMQQIKYAKTMLKCYKKLSMDLYEEKGKARVALLEKELEELEEKLEETTTSIEKACQEHSISIIIDEARDDNEGDYNDFVSIVSNFITDVATEAEDLADNPDEYMDSLKQTYPALAKVLGAANKAVSDATNGAAKEAETYIDGLKQEHPALATAMDETEKAYLSMAKAATTVIFPHDGENE